MSLFKLVLATTITFLILDAIWLGYLAKAFYIKHMGELIHVKNGNIQANWIAALLVYIVLIGGILCFVHPLAGDSLKAAFAYGLLYGLITYGTYDLTNMAVIRDWSWTVTIVDILWGMTICSITSIVGGFFKI
ncbi:DUF2177 family protein [Legionella sp. W05-934-2]|jgi:uncharacterized membrane protein|uniref:DUF2177 family protein n=1 Tax=Legionella sp. W05-934-2 TaxID=1198649 RepID=UPI0034625093